MIFNLFGSFTSACLSSSWNTYCRTFVFLDKRYGRHWWPYPCQKSQTQSLSLSFWILTCFDSRCPGWFSLNRSHVRWRMSSNRVFLCFSFLTCSYARCHKSSNRVSFALYFHFWHAVAVLLTACVFAFHLWLAHMLGVFAPACVFALRFHFWHAAALLLITNICSSFSFLTCSRTRCRMSSNRVCLCSSFSFWHAFIVVFVYFLIARVLANFPRYHFPEKTWSRFRVEIHA